SKRRQIVLLAGFGVDAPEIVDVAGATAQDGYLLLLDQIPHSPPGRMVGVSLVQDDRRSHREAAHQPVPHHPARRGNVRDAVCLFQISMQQDFFELVHKNSSRSLNHALGLPSSSRGEHDVDRMVSWQLFELRSEEHTSELQSRGHLVCRLLLEKKKK